MKDLWAPLFENKYYIFLVDGLGASISTLFLFVLASFESVFGMPKDILFQLIPVTGLFAVYSFSCYILKPQQWRRFLKGIAVANLLYCCVSLGLIYFFFDKLTWLGVLYFLSEKMVLLALSWFELRLSNVNPPE
jgi:hypothetical protein